MFVCCGPIARLPPALPQLEEEYEGQCVIVCIPDSAPGPELYTPALLYLQRPLEAPVRTSDSWTQAHRLSRAPGVALSERVCVWEREIPWASTYSFTCWRGLKSVWVIDLFRPCYIFCTKKNHSRISLVILSAVNISGCSESSPWCACFRFAVW